jgi:hypothetical protein
MENEIGTFLEELVQNKLEKVDIEDGVLKSVIFEHEFVTYQIFVKKFGNKNYKIYEIRHMYHTLMPCMYCYTTSRGVCFALSREDIKPKILEALKKNKQTRLCFLF